jgi:hypothetical protein
MRTRKSNGLASVCRPHDEMDVARAKADLRRPPALFSRAAFPPIVQSPGSAHWLSLNREGVL